MASRTRQMAFGLYTLLIIFSTIAYAFPVLDTRQPAIVNHRLTADIAVTAKPRIGHISAHIKHAKYIAKRDAQWIVHAGDTGNEIAAHLGIDFEQLAFLNPGVEWKNLQIGQTLNIPCGDDSHANHNGTTHLYVVVSGDTGNGIAAANGITFAQLEAFNQNIDWYNLQIGQTLVIPGADTDMAQYLSISGANNQEQQQDADTSATSSGVPVVPVVENGTEVMTTTKEVSPFLTPGETPQPSSEADAQTLEIRQVLATRPATPTASAGASASTKYIIKDGDTGYAIAAQYGITFDALSKANPNVAWLNLQIGQVLNIPAGIRLSSSTIISPIPAQDAPSPPIVSTSSLVNVSNPMAGAYITYSGAVTSAQPPYPILSTWMPFVQLWARNAANIGTSCTFASGSVPANSADETASLKSAILDVSSQTKVNPSFILAIMLQESNGCVRVPTTSSWEGIQNPGLMQSFNGHASCNHQGQTAKSCSGLTIKAMIMEGVMGKHNVGLVSALQLAAKQDGQRWPMTTSTNVNAGVEAGSGSNVKGNVQVQGSTHVERAQVKQMDEAMLYYQAARIYNSGSLPADGDLSAKTMSTRCYVSDVVNRLIGWDGTLRNCTLV